jgi:hypothetical protein
MKTEKEQAAELLSTLEWQKDWCEYVCDLLIKNVRSSDCDSYQVPYGPWHNEYWIEVRKIIHES